MKLEGANFDIVDYMERSALHIATICGHFNIVQFLLKESKLIERSNDVDTNLDQIDINKCSALYYAIMKNYECIAKVLYLRGATVVSPESKLAKILC